MKQLTFKQYRRIDLTILCLLTAVFETLAAFATNLWFGAQPMAVSITLALTCITMMRWNYLGVLPSLIGSLAFCLATSYIVPSTQMQQFIIHCVGSLFCVAAYPLLKKLGKEKVRLNLFKRILFVGATYVSVIFGRWLVSLIFEPTVETLLPLLLTDLLSLLFAVFVVSIAKNVDGLIEDQKAYLFRLERERKEKQEQFFNDGI